MRAFNSLLLFFRELENKTVTPQSQLSHVADGSQATSQSADNVTQTAEVISFENPNLGEAINCSMVKPENGREIETFIVNYNSVESKLEVKQASDENTCHVRFSTTCTPEERHQCIVCERNMNKKSAPDDVPKGSKCVGWAVNIKKKLKAEPKTGIEKESDTKLETGTEKKLDTESETKIEKEAELEHTSAGCYYQDFEIENKLEAERETMKEEVDVEQHAEVLEQQGVHLDTSDGNKKQESYKITDPQTLDIELDSLVQKIGQFM